jgi:threonine aldolase
MPCLRSLAAIVAFGRSRISNRMNFASDNTAGVSAPILEAIRAASAGPTSAYGTDGLTAKAEAMLAEIFETEVACFLVATGTAANALALAALTPPWGAVLCHESAHVNEDECGAPEFFTNGAKLVGIPGSAGKIAPKDLAATLARFERGRVHQVQPATLSLSQATECGTIYSPSEIAALARIAHDAGLGVHMDGARFANALVALGCTPAEASRNAGVDVLSFGATKNGALACEALIFFDPAKASSLPFQRKRSGHTLSKGRFLGAQMVAYLEAGHWLGLAKAANAAARRLAEGLAAIPGVRLPWPAPANEVFAILPRRIEAALKAAGALYYEWPFPPAGEKCAPPGDDEVFVRLVCSFATEEAEVERLLAVAHEVGPHP